MANQHDMWGTPALLARAIVETVDPGRYPAGTVWLEPSAGAGVFVEALVAAGAKNVIAVERDGALCNTVKAVVSALEKDMARDDHFFDAHHADFLQWNSRLIRMSMVAVGNPPFGGEQMLAHVAACKVCCGEMWLLGPAGLLEPCGNRGDFYEGLCRVFPLYARRFEDLSGVGVVGGGSRPTFLYHWRRGALGWGDADPRGVVVDYSLWERMRERMKVEG